MSSSTELTIAQEFQLRIERKEKWDKIIRIAPVIVMFALGIFFAVMAPGFLSAANGLTIISQMSIPLIIASGVTFVILIGCIDLSVDGVMGLCGSVIGLLVLNNKTGIALGLWAIPVVLGIGALMGLTTGLIHVRGKIPSFMVSFGMLSITTGLAVISYGAVPPVIQDQSIRAFALLQIGGLPLLAYVALAVLVIAYVIQEKTAFGKYIYAIGENESLAKVSGININRVKVLVFILLGIIVAIAGIMGAAQIGRGDVAVGNGQFFRALAAVVLGGTSLSGGKGGIISTLIGTVIITVLNNGLVLMSVNPYFKDAVMGVVLICAVILTLNRNPKQVTK